MELRNFCSIVSQLRFEFAFRNNNPSESLLLIQHFLTEPFRLIPPMKIT